MMSIEVVSTVQNLTGTEGFVGRHILLDVRTSTLRGVSETTTIYHLLEGLSMALGMTLVYPPLVARFPFAGSELSRFVESLKAEEVSRRTPSTRWSSIWRCGRTRRPASRE